MWAIKKKILSKTGEGVDRHSTPFQNSGGLQSPNPPPCLAPLIQSLFATLKGNPTMDYTPQSPHHFTHHTAHLHTQRLLKVYCQQSAYLAHTVFLYKCANRCSKLFFISNTKVRLRQYCNNLYYGLLLKSIKKKRKKTRSYNSPNMLLHGYTKDIDAWPDYKCASWTTLVASNTTLSR